MMFEASIHGIDLSKQLGSKKSGEEEGWLFNDPKEYEHLSQEEKEKLTEKKIRQTKGLANK